MSNLAIRGQLLQEIRECKEPQEKSMLEVLLGLYDKGLMKVTYDEASGECVYQATPLGLKVADELERS